MSFSNIDPIARRFISESIKSVAQLDLLLLLRTAPERQWSADELARELRTDSGWTHAQLRSMGAAGIIASAGQDSFRFAPLSADTERALTAVAQAYLVNRVSVIELIYNPQPQAIRDFADAFRFRKEPPNG